MAYEDFTTYTETDTGSKVTVTASKITYTAVTSAEVVKDFGAGHFDGDFEHLMTIQMGGSSAYGNVVWYLLDIAYPIEYSRHVALVWGGYSPGGRIAISEYGPYDDVMAAQSLPKTYYPKFKRVESVGTYGTLYGYIYSDAARTSLDDTLSLALHSKEDLRVLSAFLANTGAITYTGYIENLDLQESEAVQAPMQNAIPAVLALLMN